MTHSPEPWFVEKYPDHDVVRNNCGLWIECPGPCTAQRIAACVNACHGIPAFNGIITMVADMKAAILTQDESLLATVRERLLELGEWPPGHGSAEYDDMKPLLHARKDGAE